MQHCFFKERKAQRFWKYNSGWNWVGGLYSFPFSRLSLSLWLRATAAVCMFFYSLFSHFGNGCAKERIKCEAAAGNPKFFVEPSCQEKLVNYFFRQFCDGTLVCSKVTPNIFLGVQIAECVENTTHTWTLACQSKIKKSFLWLESKNGKHANFACLQFGPLPLLGLVLDSAWR